jgi:hypothetical protein
MMRSMQQCAALPRAGLQSHASGSCSTLCRPPVLWHFQANETRGLQSATMLAIRAQVLPEELHARAQCTTSLALQAPAVRCLSLSRSERRVRGGARVRTRTTGPPAASGCSAIESPAAGPTELPASGCLRVRHSCSVMERAGT